MALYLVRHPRPVLAQDYCYGSSDVAVSAEALARCGESVMAQLPRGAAIWSSPLQRCADLALVVARALSVETVTFDADLQEMHFGRWELCAWDDIAWAEVDAWNRDLAHHAPGGGETLVHVAQRMWRAFMALRQCDRHGDGGCIVICHGGTIRMLHACIAWQSGQGADAVPDEAAFEEIALQAAADRRSIDWGEVVVL